MLKTPRARRMGGSALALCALALGLFAAIFSPMSPGLAGAQDALTPTAGMSGMGMGPESGAATSQDMRMTALVGTPTAADQAAVDALVAAAKKATAPFKDIRVARKAGYTETSRYSPGVGVHVTNPVYWALAAHGVFDPTRPPSLLYNRSNGVWTLIGVMYVAPTADTSGDLGQILPESLVAWHQHLDLCFAGFQPVRGVATAADCQAKGDAWVAQTAWMTHAWIWQNNPDGMFTLKNPAVGRPT